MKETARFEVLEKKLYQHAKQSGEFSIN